MVSSSIVNPFSLLRPFLELLVPSRMHDARPRGVGSSAIGVDSCADSTAVSINLIGVVASVRLMGLTLTPT